MDVDSNILSGDNITASKKLSSISAFLISFSSVTFVLNTAFGRRKAILSSIKSKPVRTNAKFALLAGGTTKFENLD
jgi:hypothetical protein